MNRSDLVMWAATTAPPVGRYAVRLWAQSYLRRPRPPHWMFPALRSALGVRIRKQVSLLGAHELMVDPFDIVGHTIATKGCFEPETVHAIQRLLEPGMVAIDAGAHIGQYSVLMSAAVGPAGAIHSFEPDPATLGQLRDNIQLNCITNVTTNGMALSSFAGRSQLYLSDVSNIGGNSLRQTLNCGNRGVSVPVTTLDAYVRAARLTRLDFLKADVEGAELLLLRGGAAAIERFRPTMILEVSINQRLFDYGPGDLIAQLREWEYDLYRVGPMPLQPYQVSSKEPDDFNILAAPRRERARLQRRGLTCESCS